MLNQFDEMLLYSWRMLSIILFALGSPCLSLNLDSLLARRHNAMIVDFSAKRSAVKQGLTTSMIPLALAFTCLNPSQCHALQPRVDYQVAPAIEKFVDKVSEPTLQYQRNAKSEAS